MFGLVLYCMLSLLLAEQTVAEECQQDAQQGCKVDDGHAECKSWNLAASLHILPSCITRMTFSLIANQSLFGRDHWLHLKEVKFSRFTNLKKLELYTNHGNHSLVWLYVDESTALDSLKTTSIKVLRFRMLQDRLSNYWLNMYRNLKSLRILELTRAKWISLANAKHIIGAESSIQVLILKNIQEIKRNLICSTSADLAHFVCQSNVQHLDLSYNDIAYISFTDSRRLYF